MVVIPSAVVVTKLNIYRTSLNGGIMLGLFEQYSFNYYDLHMFWPMNLKLLEFVLQDFISMNL